MSNNTSSIVAFRIGRGGHFHNAGHKSYIGEHRIGEFTDKLFERDGIWYDEVGHDTGLTSEDIERGTGCIDIDGDYDTVFAQYITDCSKSELLIILERKFANEPEFALIREYYDHFEESKIDWSKMPDDVDDYRHLVEQVEDFRLPVQDVIDEIVAVNDDESIND